MCGGRRFDEKSSFCAKQLANVRYMYGGHTTYFIILSTFVYFYQQWLDDWHVKDARRSLDHAKTPDVLQNAGARSTSACTETYYIR